MDVETRDRLGRRFRQFAEFECTGYESLYEYLCLRIAGDDELLDLATDARPGQPLPNLFFGAVHYLLASEPASPLAAYYGSLSAEPLPANESFAAFRSFCLDHREQIRELLRSRIVQTNEVGRTACLLPAFTLISQRENGLPLALVDVGTSAGLNLLFDRYFIDYGRISWGDPASAVRLLCELSGDAPVHTGMPLVTSCVGIDLNPIDLSDDNEVRWLQALVWPGIPDRSVTLREAIRRARGNPPYVRKGNAVDLLPNLLEEIPPQAALCVLHCHTLNQFSPEDRDAFHAILAAASQRRIVYRLGMEGLPEPMQSRLFLTRWQHGEREDRELGACHAHGRWLRWAPD